MSHKKSSYSKWNFCFLQYLNMLHSIFKMLHSYNNSAYKFVVCLVIMRCRGMRLWTWVEWHIMWSQGGKDGWKIRAEGSTKGIKGCAVIWPVLSHLHNDRIVVHVFLFFINEDFLIILYTSVLRTCPLLLRIDINLHQLCSPSGLGVEFEPPLHLA